MRPSRACGVGGRGEKVARGKEVFADLPVDVSGKDEAVAVFEVAASTQVVVVAFGDAYVWGNGGYVEAQLFVNGAAEAVSRRYGVNPWVGNLQTTTSCSFVAKPGSQYTIRALQANSLGNSIAARINAFDRAAHRLYGTSTGGLSAQVVVTVPVDTSVEVVATSSAALFGGGRQEVSVKQNGQDIIPWAKSNNELQTVRTSIVLSANQRTVFDVYHRNYHATARGVSLLVAPSDFATLLYGEPTGK